MDNFCPCYSNYLQRVKKLFEHFINNIINKHIITNFTLYSFVIG